MGTEAARWDVSKAQAKLQTTYEQKFRRLVPALAEFGAKALSKPQVLDISAHAYNEANPKLLVVGQQTQEWYGGWASVSKYPPEIAIEKLVELYRKFDLGIGLRHTPFWRYAHKLYKLLNRTGPDNGFVWSNLVKMAGLNEKGEWGYPGWLVEECINKYFGMLVWEVELAQPDVVVFFTGHSYDESLKLNFPGAQLSAAPNSDLDSKYLSMVKHDLLPKHSYRIYHPGYLNRQFKGERVLETIRNLVLDKSCNRPHSKPSPTH